MSPSQKEMNTLAVLESHASMVHAVVPVVTVVMAQPTVVLVVFQTVMLLLNVDSMPKFQEQLVP